MGETFWSETAPGEHSTPISMAKGTGEDDAALLMGDLRIPDRVRIPADSPMYPGEERRGESAARFGCPKHQPKTWTEPGSTLILALDGPGAVYVAECPTCGWVVFSLGGRGAR